MTPSHVQTVLTNEIYTRIFGMSRAELLAIAKAMPCYGAAAGLLYPASDEDESMKDCFSAKALQALSTVEGRAAVAIQAVKYETMNEKQLASLLAYVVTSVCNAVAKEPMNPFEETKGE